MTCPSCGHQNRPNAGYCGVCGSALPPEPAACPACGEGVTSDDRFCAACGAALTPQPATCATCGDEVTPDAGFCGSCGAPMGLSVAVKPRTLDGLLSETWAVYRGNLRVFVLIALAPQIPAAVSLVIPIAGPSVPTILLALLGVLLYILASGATVLAVVRHYTGAAVGVTECFAGAWRRVPALLVASILVAAALFGSAILILVLIGIPLFFYLIVAWSFFTQAILVERLGPVAALERSRELVRGSWWRVFGIGIVFVLILGGLSVAGGTVGYIVSFISGAAGQGVSIVVAMLLTPFAPIGSTLVYLDLRVREEGSPVGVSTAGIVSGGD